jgi:hypothetical protein
MMNLKTILLSLLLVSNFLFAQELQEGEILWSSVNRLKESDYKIKISSQKNTPIFSQFVIRTNSIGGFDFFKKNLNKKTENVFMGNASWIEISKGYNIKDLIMYQQLQFDLSEIMTRKCRKKILENKKQIPRSKSLINKIINDIMTDFSNARLQLEKETISGTNKEILKKWEEKITIQLSELEDFNYENTDKIKISKE